MRKLLIVLMLLAPNVQAGSYAPTEQQQRRFDSCLIACMQSYSGYEPHIYNDQRHVEIEKKSIECAYRMVDQINKIDKQIESLFEEGKNIK